MIVITTTCNREHVTRKWLSQLRDKAGLKFFHILIDNGSEDGTVNYLKEYLKTQDGTILKLDKNYGVLKAFLLGIRYALKMNPQYIVKYDDDCEIVSKNILKRIKDWYEGGCKDYIVGPLDLMIPPNYMPRMLAESKDRGMNVRYVSHTGGMFQVYPIHIAKLLLECKDLDNIGGDLLRGQYFRNNGLSPIYLTDLHVKHMGIENQTKNYILR